MTPPNVLFLLVDCLRADYLDSRAGWVHVPNLLGLVHGGVRLTQMISAATTTTPCVASMMTGLYSPRHGIRSLRGYRLRPGLPTLPGLLRRQGYHAIAEVTGPLVPEVGLGADFDTYRCRERTDYLDTPWGATLVERLRALPPPWFAFVHLWELHVPRYVPAAFDARRFGRTPYERALSNLDAQLGRVLAAAGDGAITIVHGDHGERFKASRSRRRWYRLQRDLLGRPFPPWPSFPMREGHGFDVWEDMIRVPFVLHGPSRLSARTVSALTRQVDIMPTLLELAGIPPPADLDGTSLLPAVQGAPPPDLHAYTEACGASITDPADWRRGLRTARWKYIETERSAAQLYDLVHDPGERTNVVARHPEVAAALRLDLAKVARSGDETTGENRLTDDEEALVSNKLRELGYIE